MILSKWLKEHWRLVAGVVIGFKPAWESLRWIISLLGDVDFVVSSLGQPPEWLVSVAKWMVNPPGWMNPILILTAFMFIVWDIRRYRGTGAPIGEAVKASTTLTGEQVESRRELKAFALNCPAQLQHKMHNVMTLLKAEDLK